MHRNRTENQLVRTGEVGQVGLSVNDIVWDTKREIIGVRRRIRSEGKSGKTDLT